MNNKATSTFAILSLVIAMIVGIYILSATFAPLQAASTTLSDQMGATIPNESLGVANSSGDGTFYTQYSPVEASTWTVYANGTASSSWVLSTVSVTLATGLVSVQGNGIIQNENLGTADASGNGSFNTAYIPIVAGSYTITANGTDSAAWVNATASVTLATGLVTVTETGTNPSTAGAIINMNYTTTAPSTDGATITADYNVNSGIAGMKSLSSLPGVAVLLFILLVVIGFIMMAVRE